VKRSNKRGFTLVEMLLAIAIALIISGLFVSLIVSIRASYYRSYNDDDCADIATIYAEALENTVIYDIQNDLGDTIFIDESDHYILKHGTPAVSVIHELPSGFNTASTTSGVKWVIKMI